LITNSWMPPRKTIAIITKPIQARFAPGSGYHGIDDEKKCNDRYNRTQEQRNAVV
jgi:hypothetical protein